MEFQAYLAIGEETTRGTKQATTVGFIPLTGFNFPGSDFMTKKRGEFRGESSRLGHTLERRMGQKVEGSFTFPLFSEAGSTKGIIGTLFKHFMGKAVSAQNAATGQFAHMAYCVSDPWAAANLGTRALTLNYNIIAASGAITNYPVLGVRITKIKIIQKTADDGLCTVNWVGQKIDATTAGIASPVFAAENLRMDYGTFSLYTGAVTRTGTPPNYTNIVQNAATRIQPDEVTLELDNKLTDKMVLDGNRYPTKTTVGVIEGSLAFKIDWEDPASGFSSVDDFNVWLAGVSSMNGLLTWDTGVQAGTGLTHALIVDLPICNRTGGDPKIKQNEDPDIDLKYDFHYDPTTTLYAAGVLLRNTATAV